MGLESSEGTNEVLLSVSQGLWGTLVDSLLGHDRTHECHDPQA